VKTNKNQDSVPNYSEVVRSGPWSSRAPMAQTALGPYNSARSMIEPMFAKFHHQPNSLFHQCCAVLGSRHARYSKSRSWKHSSKCLPTPHPFASNSANGSMLKLFIHSSFHCTNCMAHFSYWFIFLFTHQL